jgi:gamma-glutamyltranspeptidase/glutathione hydrolase
VEALAEAYARGYATIGGTAYVCAADGEGMGVSLIQSVYHGFGSRCSCPGYGFVLQNRGAGFVLDEGHPNQFAPGQAAVPHDHPGRAAGPDGRWEAVFGVTGGQYPAAGPRAGRGQHARPWAGPAGRARRAPLPAGGDGSVSLESPLADLAGRFGSRPTAVVDTDDNYGNGHVIVRRPDGRLLGGTEPRRDGLAVGF